MNLQTLKGVWRSFADSIWKKSPSTVSTLTEKMGDLYVYECENCPQRITLGDVGERHYAGGCINSTCLSTGYTRKREATPDDTITGEAEEHLLSPKIEDHIDTSVAVYVIYYNDRVSLQHNGTRVAKQMDISLFDNLSEDEFLGVIEYVIRTQFNHLEVP